MDTMLKFSQDRARLDVHGYWREHVREQYSELASQELPDDDGRISLFTRSKNFSRSTVVFLPRTDKYVGVDTFAHIKIKLVFQWHPW